MDRHNFILFLIFSVLSSAICFWKKRPLVGLYKRSYQWKYETERKFMVDIEAAKSYANEKGYQHIMFCHQFVDLEKNGFAIPNTAIFFKNSINLPWLGTSSQCDWYNKVEKFEKKEKKRGPIDGGWSFWTNYTPCVGGVRARRRSCDNPDPRNGGKPCSGRKISLESCQMTLKETFEGCTVPPFQPGRTLKESIRLLRRFSVFTQKKMSSIVNDINKFRNGMIVTRSGPINIYGMQKEYRDTRNILTKKQRRLKLALKRASGHELYKNRRELSYCIKDLSDINQFIDEVEKMITEKKVIRKELFAKRSEGEKLLAELKGLAHDYTYYGNYGNYYTWSSNEIEEERDLLNDKIKANRAKLAYIFCR